MVRARRAVTPSGETAGCVAIAGGGIVAVKPLSGGDDRRERRGLTDDEAPPAFVTNEREVTPIPMPDADGAWVTARG